MSQNQLTESQTSENNATLIKERKKRRKTTNEMITRFVDLLNNRINNKEIANKPEAFIRTIMGIESNILQENIVKKGCWNNLKQ